MFLNSKFIVMYTSVIVFLSLAYVSSGAGPTWKVNCSKNVSLQDEQIYNIQNHGYPDHFLGTEYYTWCVRAQKNIRVTCDEIDIPLSKSCKRHSLTVEVPWKFKNRYCGMRDIKIDTGSQAIVTFNSSDRSMGSKFRCSFEVAEEMEEEDDYFEDGGSNVTYSIVGGREAGNYEFPMMAGIVDVSQQKQIICGATIISSKHVLTATHCLIGRKVSDLLVVIGENDITTNRDRRDTKVYRVHQFIRHPRYDSNAGINDIAIVAIRQNIRFTSKINAVSLPSRFDTGPDPPAYVWLIGWGSTKFGYQPSKVLRTVEVNIISNDECRKYWPDVDDKQLCTFSFGKDACQFDSGGPVLYWNPNWRKWVLVGIISYGKNCGKDAPSVNVRVARYTSWILKWTRD